MRAPRGSAWRGALTLAQSNRESYVLADRGDV